MSKNHRLLPASSHALWVSYYAADQFNVPSSEEELDLILEVEPVIGWLWRGRKKPLLEVTPYGPIEVGVVRLRGESKREARDLGMAELKKAYERYQMAKAETVAGDA